MLVAYILLVQVYRVIWWGDAIWFLIQKKMVKGLISSLWVDIKIKVVNTIGIQQSTCKDFMLADMTLEMVFVICLVVETRRTQLPT